MSDLKKIELEERKSSWRSKKALILSGLILTVLAVLQIWAQNTLVSYGEKFDKLNQYKASLEIENQILENEIAEAISLDKVATASSLLGLSVAKDIQYLH